MGNTAAGNAYSAMRRKRDAETAGAQPGTALPSAAAGSPDAPTCACGHARTDHRDTEPTGGCLECWPCARFTPET